MTLFDRLLLAEKTCHTIEIEEKETGKKGVANSTKRSPDSAKKSPDSTNGCIAVFYGNDDGSDDTIVTPDEFNARFIITATLSTPDSIIAGLKASIKRNIDFYTSDFCRNEMTDVDRKEILHRLQGKKEALEIVTARPYLLTVDGLVEDTNMD